MLIFLKEKNYLTFILNYKRFFHNSILKLFFFNILTILSLYWTSLMEIRVVQLQFFSLVSCKQNIQENIYKYIKDERLRVQEIANNIWYVTIHLVNNKREEQQTTLTKGLKLYAKKKTYKLAKTGHANTFSYTQAFFSCLPLNDHTKNIDSRRCCTKSKRANKLMQCMFQELITRSFVYPHALYK